MRIPATITIIILFSAIAGCTTGSQRTRPPSEWQTGPGDPEAGLNGPSVPTVGAFAGDMCLGSDGTKKGDTRNNATVPAFTCTGRDNYCEVTFFANVPLQDSEQIRVKVSAGPNKNLTGYIKQYSGSSWQYRLALEGACGDDITVSFDWGMKGDNPASV